MNTLVWLWDVLVGERRMTRLPEAINAAYQAGYSQALNDMLVAAKQQSHHEFVNAYGKRAEGF